MTDSLRDTLLLLSEHLLRKNREFANALRQKEPPEHLRIIHSQIQEVYNQILLVQQTGARRQGV